MRIAFYAPLKPPTSAVPSGDRGMARNLMRALQHDGHMVALASRFRSWEGAGDERRQERLRQIGEGLARRLLRQLTARPLSDRPELWLTYHLYHKAPDWLGPEISARLGIPYVVVEASLAGKQAQGNWRLGHRAVETALGRAAAVIALNSADVGGIEPALASSDRLHHVRPFIATELFSAAGRDRAACRAALARRFDLGADAPILLAVGMMRPGDKLASYRALADALARLGDSPWQLLIVGDGVARDAVEVAFARFLDRRIVFAGQLAYDDLPPFYAGADLFVWPAIREAYGLVFLEAAACGTPSIAGDCDGVPDVVHDGESGLLVPEGDVAAFASELRAMIEAPARRVAMGARAAEIARRLHNIEPAAENLSRILEAARATQGAARLAEIAS